MTCWASQGGLTCTYKGAEEEKCRHFLELSIASSLLCRQQLFDHALWIFWLRNHILIYPSTPSLAWAEHFMISCHPLWSLIPLALPEGWGYIARNYNHCFAQLNIKYGNHRNILLIIYHIVFRNLYVQYHGFLLVVLIPSISTLWRCARYITLSPIFPWTDLHSPFCKI
jgi:hypothetical protein